MLTRWDPFSELSRLHPGFGRLFTESDRGGFSPAVNIYEEEDAIVLEAELPGLTAEEIDIDVHQNVLTLSGERKLEKEEKRDGYHRVERQYGSFARSFVLPRTVDSEHIDAKLDAGVLVLRLPKRAEAQARKIAIASS